MSRASSSFLLSGRPRGPSRPLGGRTCASQQGPFYLPQATKQAGGCPNARSHTGNEPANHTALANRLHVGRRKAHVGSSRTFDFRARDPATTHSGALYPVGLACNKPRYTTHQQLRARQCSPTQGRTARGAHGRHYTSLARALNSTPNNETTAAEHPTGTAKPFEPGDGIAGGAHGVVIC